MDVTGQKMSSKKYFLAIVIPDPLFTKIEEIKEHLLSNFGLKGALRSPAHITLHRPFEWQEEKEHLLREKLRSFPAALPFSLRLQGFEAFGNRVIYIAVGSNPKLLDQYNALKKFSGRE